MLEYMGILGPIDGMEMERIPNTYTLAFFQKYLEGKEASLLDGPPAAGQYLEVLITARRAPTTLIR
jgi:hypothetical protein